MPSSDILYGETEKEITNIDLKRSTVNLAELNREMTLKVNESLTMPCIRRWISIGEGGWVRKSSLSSFSLFKAWNKSSSSSAIPQIRDLCP